MEIKFETLAKLETDEHLYNIAEKSYYIFAQFYMNKTNIITYKEIKYTVLTVMVGLKYFSDPRHHSRAF